MGQSIDYWVTKTLKTEHLFKVVSVIQSCKNPEQVKTADDWALAMTTCPFQRGVIRGASEAINVSFSVEQERRKHGRSFFTTP